MKNATLIALVGAALALSPAVLVTGAAAASGHHLMMKKKKTAKMPKSEPMQKAGTVGEKSSGTDQGPNSSNTGTGPK